MLESGKYDLPSQAKLLIFIAESDLWLSTEEEKFLKDCYTQLVRDSNAAKRNKKFW